MAGDPLSIDSIDGAETVQSDERARTAARRGTNDWTRFRRFFLPSLTLAIFLVSLIHSFIKTQTVEDELERQVTSAIWLASQTQIEYLQWLAELDRRAHDGTGLRSGEAMEGLGRLRDRLAAVLEGEGALLLRRSFQAEINTSVRPLLGVVDHLSAEFTALDGAAAVEVGRMRDALGPHGPALHRLVEATRELDGAAGPTWLDRNWAAYWEVGWSLAGMLFSGALLLVILIREIHRGDDLLRKSHAAEAALLLARNAAEQANNAKSRFLVAANHDMRQPLQSLSLYTAALQGSRCETERETICGEMSGAIQAMGTMLDVLLDIENLEDGHVRVEFTKFPVSDLLSSIEREFRLPAREKGVDLRVVPSSLMIRSDPALLERIVQNLVSNAVSYTQNGKVVVGCRRMGGRACIEVWDNGVGVAESELHTIFEDYYQVDNPARDRRRGLGLGLAIVKRIASLLDHEILVRSKLGVGSLFAIAVPRAAGAIQQPARAPAERRAPRTLAGRVLVVIEDDATILHGLERLLTSWGAEVFACSTIDEALIQLSLAARQPDLVVADYRLSHRASGLEAVEKTRASFGAALPAIVITGDTSANVTDSIRASDCRLAHKPLEPQMLRRLIDEVLSATENGPDREDATRAIGDPVEKLEQV